MGPTTIIHGNNEIVLDIASALTIRYSDAPSGAPVRVKIKQGDVKHLVTSTMPDEMVETYRV